MLGYVDNNMETLQLKSGIEISFDNGKPIKEHKPILIEVPTYKEAQNTITRIRKELSELPAPPKQMNTASVILSYELFGLSSFDIAIATNLKEEQIKNIQESHIYKSLRNDIVSNILKQDADNIRNMVQQKSKAALSNIVDLMDSEMDNIALAASKDILDRAGHRPVDVVEHKHSMEGGLTIEIIKQEAIDTPLIDITPGVF